MHSLMFMLALASEPDAPDQPPLGGGGTIIIKCPDQPERDCSPPYPLPPPPPGPTTCEDGPATCAQICEALGDGYYACPDADDLVVPAEHDEEVTILVFAPDSESGEGWECRDDGWCLFDYGLASDSDAVEAPPGAGGGGCEPQPGPTPPSGGTSGGGRIRILPISKPPELPPED